MKAIVPSAELSEVFDPYYPKAGNGRSPIGLEWILRIHFVQHWFNLADLACEEALYDNASPPRFVGNGLGREPVPDSTTSTKFPCSSTTTRWAKRCLPGLARNCKHADSKSIPAPAWTPPTSARRVQPRMQIMRVTPRCIKARRTSSRIWA